MTTANVVFMSPGHTWAEILTFLQDRSFVGHKQGLIYTVNKIDKTVSLDMMAPPSIAQGVDLPQLFETHKQELESLGYTVRDARSKEKGDGNNDS